MTVTVTKAVEYIRPRFNCAEYNLTIDQRGLPNHNPVGHPALVMGVRCYPVPVQTVVRPVPPPTPSVFDEQPWTRGQRPRRLENMGRGGATPVGGSLALPRPVRAEPVVKEELLIDLLDTDIPDKSQREACLQPVTKKALDRDRIFNEMSSTPSLEGATCVGSVGVSPLQRRDAATVLPCPERPEENDKIIVGAPEGLPHPVSVLPALAGIPSPKFPRVVDFAVRRSLQLYRCLDKCRTEELFTSPHRTISIDARLLQAGPTGARTSYEGRDGSPRYGLGRSRTWTSVWWETLRCHFRSSSLTGCGAPHSSPSHAHL